MEFLSYLISGLSLGSIYAIIALGYTMVYGIAKMLNFAHGDIIMVGGYVSFCAMSYLGLPALPAALLAMLISSAVGGVIGAVAGLCIFGYFAGNKLGVEPNYLLLSAAGVVGSLA